MIKTRTISYSLGIKPLYFLQTERGFYFSSEFKSFLLVQEFEPQVDRHSLDRLLTFKHIPHDRCLLKNVTVLQPGHLLVFDTAKFETRTIEYYQILNRRLTTSTPSPTEAKKEVCRLFDRAVKMRLMSDVPLGVALSGGLDSSAVVASVARQADSPPKTFSIHLGGTVNELEFARLVADRYQTDHHELTLEPEALPELAPKVLWHIEEPISVSEISTYYLGLAVKPHVKVLLCGEGSDELFGGYSRFQPLNMLSILPKKVLQWGYVRGMNGFTHSQRRRLYSTSQLPYTGSNSNPQLNQALGEHGNSMLNKFLHWS